MNINGGFFAGGVAKGVQQSIENDQQSKALGLRDKLFGLEQQKVEKQAQKQLLDDANTNFKDLVALAKSLKESAGSPDTVPQKSLDTIRARIEQTGAMLSQIPGGGAAARNALDQFDAVVTGMPTKSEAGAAKGQADAAELSGKLEGVLGRAPTDQEKAQAVGVFKEEYGPVTVENGLVIQKDKTTGKINVLFKPETPESITVGADGKVTFTKGNVTATAGDKALSTKAAEKLPELTDSLSSLQTVRGLYKPEYLTLPAQGAANLTAFVERLGLSPDPKSKQALSDITTFMQKSQAQLNATMRAVAGQAVAPSEEGRLNKEMPNADKDSPTQYLAKMDSKIADLKLFTARYAYAAKNGIAFDKINLDSMPQIMRNREAEIRKANPGIKDDVLGRQLAEEFGLIGFVK
jgi:hypothetical protein